MAHLAGAFEPQIQAVETLREIAFQREQIPELVDAVDCLESLGKIPKSKLPQSGQNASSILRLGNR